MGSGSGLVWADRTDPVRFWTGSATLLGSRLGLTSAVFQRPLCASNIFPSLFEFPLSALQYCLYPRFRTKQNLFIPVPCFLMIDCIALLGVSGSWGRNSRCNRMTVSIRFPVTTEEIRQCWYDEISSLAVFLLHLESLSQPWRLASRSYKTAGVNTCRLPKKKRIVTHILWVAQEHQRRSKINIKE